MQEVCFCFLKKLNGGCEGRRFLIFFCLCSFCVSCLQRIEAFYNLLHFCTITMQLKCLLQADRCPLLAVLHMWFCYPTCMKPDLKKYAFH